MKPNKPTNTEKVLRVLRANIETGIHGFDLIQYAGEEYKTIITSLQKQKHDITAIEEARDNISGYRYFLKG